MGNWLNGKRDGYKHIGNPGHVEWLQYEPGNGTRYSVFKMNLPADVEGGHWDTHCLIVAYSPYKAAYVFEEEASLTVDYIAEKLGLPDNDDRLHICQMVADLTGGELIGV